MSALIISEPFRLTLLSKPSAMCFDRRCRVRVQQAEKTRLDNVPSSHVNLLGEVVRSEVMEDSSIGFEAYLVCLDTPDRLPHPNYISAGSFQTSLAKRPLINTGDGPGAESSRVLQTRVYTSREHAFIFYYFGISRRTYGFDLTASKSFAFLTSTSPFSIPK